MIVRNTTLAVCVAVLLAVPCLLAGAANPVGVIGNPSFETLSESRRGLAPQWNPEIWSRTVKAEIVNGGYDGEKCLFMDSDALGSAQVMQNVYLKPFSTYRFTGWIKTENVRAEGNGGVQFVLHGEHYEPLRSINGTNDWTKIEVTFDTGNDDSTRVACFYGWGGQASGKVWFDDMKLELLSSKEVVPQVVIEANKHKAPMSKYIYGQFIEHLGRCIYGGIWAEMLQDRKFFYNVGERESPWRMSGEDAAGGKSVRMTNDNSYVNGHTPMIVSMGSAHSSLYQSGLGLLKGKEYTGRIVLSGNDVKHPVEVSLVWGKNPKDRQTVVIAGKKIGKGYSKFPLKFKSGATTDDGRIEISLEGEDVVRVGAVSLMPADNVKGFRADTLALLKELNSPVYRWPGGNFVSGYDWKDGIGDPDTRPTRKNPAWSGIEPNDVGIHEFMSLCRLLKTEPYIAANTGAGTAEMAAQEIEYCNGDTKTPMGKLRAENGDSKPFNVKWWGVGNEMYGSWQIGHMSAEEYVKKHNEVAKAMWAKDPTIKLVASGDVGPWDEMLYANCADYMNYMSQHFYKQDWHTGGLMTHVNQIPDAIRDYANTHHRYWRSIPELKGKKIPVIMDEWNYWYGGTPFGELGTRYFMRDGLGIAAGLNEFSRQSDVYFMANYAQTVNVIGCIKTTKTAAAFETTGLALKMYRDHFGLQPVVVTGAPQPLDVAASWNADKTALTIAVVNPTHDVVSLQAKFIGAKLKGSGKLWYMANGDDMAYNDPGQIPKVTIQSKDLKNVNGKLEVPAVSACIFVLNTRK